MSILEYMNEDQLKSIINIIKKRCHDFRLVDELFYEPYAWMRRKHSLTLAVISGFSPDDLNIEGFTSHNIYYGINMVQPEITGKKIVFQIYSDSSKLDNKAIKDNCKKYNSDSNYPLFLIITFKVNEEKELKSINVNYLDGDSNVIKVENVYKNSIIVSKSA